MTEQTLHAYVDGLLDRERCIEVEAYLAEHPEESRRVEAYIGQNRALHREFDKHLAAPLPPSLERLGKALEEELRPRRRFPALAAIAASLVVASLAGAVSIWLSWNTGTVYEPSASAGPGPLAGPRMAFRQHLEKFGPSEVVAESLIAPGPDLMKQLGTGTGAAFGPPPDLSSFGLQLVGGRSLAGSQSWLLQLLYETPDKARVALSLAPASPDYKLVLTVLKSDDRSILMWQKGDVIYGLVGGLGARRMAEIAKAIEIEVAAASRKDPAHQVTNKTVPRGR